MINGSSSNLVKNVPPPLVNDNEQGLSGGPREKLISLFLRGRMIFCYHANRFSTVSLFSEIFT